MREIIGLFNQRRERDNKAWRWLYKEGEWFVIHGRPDEYYLPYTQIETPREAALTLWCLREKPWFAQEDAMRYVRFVNGANGWNYTVNSLLMEVDR